MGSTIKGSVEAARAFLVFLFFFEGAVGEASECFLFLASVSAVLVFLRSEAVDRLFGFEPVSLVGKTVGTASCLGTTDSAVAGFFFFFAAILGSMPGRPSALRFSASL